MGLLAFLLWVLFASSENMVSYGSAWCGAGLFGGCGSQSQVKSYRNQRDITSSFCYRPNIFHILLLIKFTLPVAAAIKILGRKQSSFFLAVHSVGLGLEWQAWLYWRIHLHLQRDERSHGRETGRWCYPRHSQDAPLTKDGNARGKFSIYDWVWWKGRIMGFDSRTILMKAILWPCQDITPK